MKLSKTKKNVIVSVLAVILFAVGMMVYQVNFNYRFRTVEPNKVYRSGVIPPAKLADYVHKYKIKSIIDLRMPGQNDIVDNPELVPEVKSEMDAAAKIKGLNYFNVGSGQIPTENNLKAFFKVLDNKDNYPVLIHCHHGVGRAGIYSAIYQIEYEGLSNQQARINTRSLEELRPLIFSSFDDGKEKGEYLKAYKKHRMQIQADSIK